MSHFEKLQIVFIYFTIKFWQSFFKCSYNASSYFFLFLHQPIGNYLKLTLTGMDVSFCSFRLSGLMKSCSIPPLAPLGFLIPCKRCVRVKSDLFWLSLRNLNFSKLLICSRKLLIESELNVWRQPQPYPMVNLYLLSTITSFNEVIITLPIMEW